ncbi:unnamed protein product [Phyllotreta striolata]|uniref:Uncharacterized protein n=1 Tax=Phyllotreta striolata TaxID=444603 RepID=A0A9N9TLI7_PHYSR|nr:unnamed protein product [Phyllotreta striolata]
MEPDEILTKRIDLMLENYFKMAETERQNLFDALKMEISRHFEDDKVPIISISSWRYCVMDEKSSMYKDFPYWSFGVHSKPTPKTMLFGRFYIDKLEGRLMIDDNVHKMPCSIINSTVNLSIFYNTYILLKDYKIVTEIFRDPNVKNWEYLIANFEDVILLHPLEKCSLFGTVPPLRKFPIIEEIVIVRKSQVSLREITVMTVETHLEIISVQLGIRAYLSLPHLYSRIHLFLREGFKYKLYTNRHFMSKDNRKLRSIEQLQCFVISPEDNVYFEEVEKYENFTEIENGLISFERAVCNRDFVENNFINESSLAGLPSGFKNLDNKTNTVDFSESKQDGLRLYLSNKELKVRPMGFIPDMILRVRNVRKKPKYLQPTVFTTIEIVRYEPKVPFCSANLSETMYSDWGPRYFLSKGNGIPKNVIIWSEIYETKIYELKITKPKNIQELTDKSSTNCDEDKMKFYMVLFATDMFGRSRVYSNEADFVKKMLNLSDVNFEKLSEVCQFVTGSYSFSDQDEIEDTDEHQINVNQMGDSNLFQYLLTKFIRHFNRRGLHRSSLWIKCRKESDVRPSFKPRPNWKLLDMKTVHC